MPSITAQNIQMILLSVMTVGILAYLPLFFWLTKIKKTEHDAEKKALTEADQIIQDATNSSKELVADYTRKAHQILENAATFNDSSKATLEAQLGDLGNKRIRELDDATKDFVFQYHKSLDEYQKNLETRLSQLTQNIEAQEKSSLEQLQKDIKMKSESLLSKEQTDLLSDLQNLQTEISAYRKDRLANIDKDVTRLANQLSVQLLGKSIPLEDHQNLVLDSLKKFKDAHEAKS